MAADSASALPAAVVDAARAFDSTLAQVGGDTEGGQGGGGGFLEAARRSPRSMRRGLGAPGVHLSQRVLTRREVPLSRGADDTLIVEVSYLSPQRYNHE